MQLTSTNSSIGLIYAAGPKDIIKAIGKIQSQSTSNPSSVSQAAAVEALNGTQDFIQNRSDAFKERRDFVVNRLNNIKGINCLTPNGAFYVFPSCKGLLNKKTKLKTDTEFVQKLLEIVLGSRHEIICVLTQPDRRSGRGKKLQFSPVKKIALEKEINLLQPETLKDTKAVTRLAELEPDLILVVAYGLIVPPNILEIPKLGCINVHASLLPKWRGASPMEYAILNGDKKVGISYMKMSEGLDEGPVYEMHTNDLNDNDDLSEVEKKLIQLSKNNLNAFLDKVETGNVTCIDQENKEATFAPKIEKNLLQLNWADESAEVIVRKINALGNKYGTYTYLGDKRVKIFKAQIYNKEAGKNPGHIEMLKNRMIVSCSEQTAVAVDTIQMQGKNKVSGIDFISGYSDLIGVHKNFRVAVQ